MTKRDLPIAAVPTRPGLKSDISDVVLKRWNPDIRAAQDEEDASISILEPIGADWFGNGVTAKRIAGALRNIGERDVVVNINSPGGDFFEGLAIYNLLNEHPGAVTVKVLGLAASAASLIAMSGDRILMARAGFLMIHNTWVLAAGDRHAFRDVADWLEPFDAASVDVYEARSGVAAKEIAAMLDKETWIGGSDAVEQGFADDLLGSHDVTTGGGSGTSESEAAALTKIDIHLGRAGLTRSERRGLLAALNGGKPGAASSGMPSAAVSQIARTALDKLNSI
ncbi:head maturation protease, ClpP-related [Thalassococcus sp. S3]|uniref:head maturation protease, ClpP-related n=1 Tax=Thalassococcus sp. S3 TaxID=2017482 RepID=UPI001023F446|nr:head maturation protease, ClpP-related [Thalassococcus sp. S3]QBF32152.1 peptidase [Thalassococcus sp. S3]